MKIALGFWGLTRSLTYTLESIEKNILTVLKKSNEVTIFIHTYSLDTPYSNEHAHEKNIVLNNDEWKLLKPDFIEIENQDQVKRQINLPVYRSMGDHYGRNFQTVDNFICAMYSKKKLTDLITSSNITFDYIIFLRPDVKYLHAFDLRLLDIVKDNVVCVPNFGPKFVPSTATDEKEVLFSDRFALCNGVNYKAYGNVFDRLLDYSKRYTIYSERFNYDCLIEDHIDIKLIPFYFNRVRADGREIKIDNRRFFYTELAIQGVAISAFTLSLRRKWKKL